MTVRFGGDSGETKLNALRVESHHRLADLHQIQTEAEVQPAREFFDGLKTVGTTLDAILCEERLTIHKHYKQKPLHHDAKHNACETSDFIILTLGRDASNSI